MNKPNSTDRRERPLVYDYIIYANGWVSPRTPRAAQRSGCGAKFQSPEQAEQRLRAEGFNVRYLAA